VPGRARVSFDQVQPGYYAFWARQVQGMLVPACRWRAGGDSGGARPSRTDWRNPSAWLRRLPTGNHGAVPRGSHSAMQRGLGGVQGALL